MFMGRFIQTCFVVVNLCCASLSFAQSGYEDRHMDTKKIELVKEMVRSLPSSEARSSEELFREAQKFKNDPVQAILLFRRSLAKGPETYNKWINFALALKNASQSGGSNAYSYHNEASTAAYAAYVNAGSQTQKAESLRILGETYEIRQSWFNAIKAYQWSLRYENDPTLQTHLKSLREERGFRVTGFNISSQSGMPQVCFNFSDSLSGTANMDWYQYVRIEGLSDFSVIKEEYSNSKLCISGLNYSKQYKITLRQGLPSSNSDSLFKDYVYDIETHNRDSVIRFTGRNYVLPSTGQQGIPVATINHSAISIDILKISDRNLVNNLQSNSGQFLNQISTFVHDQMKTKQASLIWTGSLSTENILNKETITSFPIADAVKKFEPGVYVMVARPVPDQQEASSEDEEEYYDSYDELATQWFIVSDLGITAFSGQDGIHIMVNSLATAKPVTSAKVRIIARNNEILSEKALGKDGFVSFDPGISRGKDGMEPDLAVVLTDNDYAFLDLRTTAFDLTDRGVKGAAALNSQEVFLYTERGVYRPGETVQLTALFRDHKGLAIEKTPLIIKVNRADGVEYQVIQSNDQGAGGRVHSIPLIPSSMRGIWSISAYTDPKLPALGTVSFSVEDYVPDRMKVELSSDEEVVSPDKTVQIKLKANYLFGAPANDLKVSGQVKVYPTDGFPGYQDYFFGLSDDDTTSSIEEVSSESPTDANGEVTVSVPLSEISTTKPLKADIRLEVSEDGGRAVFKAITLPLLPGNPVIGVKQLDAKSEHDETVSFDLVYLDTNLKQQADKEVQWVFYRVINDYQWYSVDGRWKYQALKRKVPLKNGTVAMEKNSPSRLTVPADTGYRYELEVFKAVENNKIQTSYTFSKGWFVDDKAKTPDHLELSLDKDTYNSDEVMKIRISPRIASEVFLAAVGDKIYPLQSVWVPEGGSVLDIPVSAEWGTNVYLIALSHRPMNVQAKRQPDRAVGVAWFNISKSERTLSVQIKSGDVTRPNQSVSIPVEIKGLGSGETAHLTLALVDNGILSLTNYKLPDPLDYFYGQRTLGADLRDLYGFLIDGMLGSKGALRSGGDEISERKMMPGLAQEPLIRFSGIVKSDENGMAAIDFELPDFNGSGKIMVVAWTKNRLGSSEKDLIVRDKVVTSGTLPRFLMIGDETQLTTVLHNVEGQEGDYTLNIDVKGPVLIDSQLLHHEMKLKQSQKNVLSLPFKVGGVGEVVFDLSLSGPDGYSAKQSLKVTVLPGSQSRLTSTQKLLKSGEELNITSDLLNDVVYGTGEVAVSIAPVSGFDVPALLTSLDRYPHGCTEQTTSRALPLLYLNELAAKQALTLDEGLEDRVNKAIIRLLARQSSAGSFGMWGVGDSDIWLNAFVSDFLTRASEKGFSVPRSALDRALNYMSNQVANSSSIDSDAGVAYAAYVLARNGRPVIGDLRYMAENRVRRMGPLAQAQVATALALLGDEERAKKVFELSVSNLKSTKKDTSDWRSYGSRLRDISAMLSLSFDIPSLHSFSGDLIQQLQDEQTRRREQKYYYTSTQEKTWLVLAARSIFERAKNITTKINDNEQKGIIYRNYPDKTLLKNPVTIENTSSSDLFVSLDVTGNPLKPLPSEENGISISRSYYTITGEPISISKVHQNDRIVVLLHISVSNPVVDRFILSDFLPAGFELENPKLGDADNVQLGWIGKLSTASHIEHRDDRFTVAFERNQSSQVDRGIYKFQYAYSVRAVSPGDYIVPAAEVEAMYSPYVFGRTAYERTKIISPQDD